MRRLVVLLAVIASVAVAACAGDGPAVTRLEGGIAASTAAPTVVTTAPTVVTTAATVVTTPPDPTTTTASTTTVPPLDFSEPFDQPDGQLTNGWSNPSPAPTMRVVDGKASSDGADSYRAALKRHGVDVSGDWQLDVDIDAPTDDDEGVSVLLLDSSFKGVGFFAGNAVHIQEFTGELKHVNHANEGRPGGGAPGHLAQHLRMTFRQATGEYVVYLDGERWASASAPVEHFSVTAGDTIVIDAGSLHSPDYEATLDNITLKGSID